jgi:hypothetical protein
MSLLENPAAVQRQMGTEYVYVASQCHAPYQPSSNKDDLKNSVFESMHTVPKDWFAVSTRMLLERWQQCIDLSGEDVQCAYV